MSDIQLPTFIEKLLERILAENDFIDYSKMIKAGSKAGDGLTSQLISITISDHHQVDKKLDLICKIEPKDEFYRKELCTNIAFDRESTFYNEILPMIIKFQEEKNIPKERAFASWAKCFVAQATDEESVIILEDLRPQSFRMLDKSKPSPIENARLVMRELGKFHGVSLAIKDQRPNDFAKMKKLHNLLKQLCQTESTMSDFNGSFDIAIQTIKNKDHQNIMRDIKENFLAHLEHCFNDEASNRFGVLCHGDFWNNNILHRFNENGAVESIRFLDWQLVSYASPAIDLLQYLFTSTNKEIRDKEYAHLLELYYESLSETVRMFGSNPDELFTFNDLQAELKQCGNLALIVAPLVIQYSQIHSNELSNAHEVSGQNVDMHQKEEYTRQINGLLEDIVKFEYYHRIGSFEP